MLITIQSLKERSWIAIYRHRIWGRLVQLRPSILLMKRIASASILYKYNKEIVDERVCFVTI